MALTAPSRASLRHRVMVVVGCLLALVIVVSVLCGLLVRAWDHSNNERGQMRVTTSQIADLRLAYSDQETGIRGYQLTGDDTSLAPYREGTGLARAMLARLRDAPANAEIGLLPQLVAVEQAAGRWSAEVADVVLDPSRPHPDEVVAQQRFDDVRAELDRLDAIVVAELQQRSNRADDLKQITIGVLIGSSLTACAAIVLMGVMFRRWVARPLATISQSARAVAADNTSELPNFESAELNDVVDAIRALQESLARERDRALTAYKGLEQSALLAIQVRNELADALGDPPPGWSVSSALVPAEGLVAGDCYDLGLLDQRRMYAVIVDVTGHGATAALDALKAKSQLRAGLRSRLSPGAALEWLSRENAKDERADLLTAVVAVVDIESGVCQYASAGHPPPLLFRGEELLELPPTGPLLGAFAATWETESVMIDPGWTLLLHTDGITEALGAERQRFGDQRFVDCVTAVGEAEPNQLVADILESVRQFSVGARTDDVTLVALQRHGDSVPSHVVDQTLATVPS